MENLLSILSIAGAISIGAMSPGPSFVMVARTAVSSSRADGLAAALGMGAGGVLFAGAEDARLSPDGSTLWVVDAGADAVSGFTVDGGTLVELPTSPTPGPAGASPSGLVVT